MLKPSLTVGLLPRSLPRAVLYRLPPLSSPQDLLVRFLHNLGDAVGLAHRAAGRLVLIVELSSVHLALMLMKIKFIDFRRSNFESLNVTRLTFHDASVTICAGLTSNQGVRIFRCPSVPA